MPQSAAITKINAAKAYGARVVLTGSSMDDCFAEAFQQHIEKDHHFIHAFDDLDIIAGQGTVGLELLEQLDETACVVVPVGGGGLIGGIAACLKEASPAVKIIGVEAAGAASMANAVNLGRIESAAGSYHCRRNSDSAARRTYICFGTEICGSAGNRA